MNTDGLDLMERIGRTVDALGVLIIVVCAAVATGRFLLHIRRDFADSYRS